ncbi:MAG: shikimate kinase [Bacteroidales bacterium]|nr:shikimate kinase [Bacteroidales bacterium]
MIISLTGFMGCGKSSVGRKLSELLCCPFMDLDDVIEERAGRTIPEIFASEGEAEFRRMEAEALEACIEMNVARNDAPLAPSHSRAAGPSPYPGVGKCQLRSHPLPLEECTISSEGKTRGVLALGGGAVMTPSCAKLVHKHTLCIYLRASVETLLAHLSGEADKRPLLQNNTDQTTSDCHFDRAASDCHFDRAERVEKSPTLRQRIETLMSLRSSTYEKTAHIIIDTDGKSIDSICQEIISTAILPRP